MGPAVLAAMAALISYVPARAGGVRVLYGLCLMLIGALASWGSCSAWVYLRGRRRAAVLSAGLFLAAGVLTVQGVVLLAAALG